MGLTLGNGASTVLSVLAVVVLARTLGDRQFVLVNLLLTVVSVIHVAGGGVDGAAVRTLTGGDGRRGVLRVAAYWRAGLLVLMTAGFAPFGVRLAERAGVSPGLVVGACLALGAGVSTMALAMVRPQAEQRYLRYALVQNAFYGAVLAGSAYALVSSSVDRILGIEILVGALFAAVGLRAVWTGTAAVLPRHVRGEFLGLARILGLSTLLFAVFERVDLLLVTMVAPPDLAAHYAVAVRYAGGMALVTGAFASFVLPKVVRCRSVQDLRRERLELRPSFALVVLAAVVAACVGPWVVPLAFGGQHAGLGVAVTVLLAQYPLVAWQTTVVAVFPGLGRGVWQLELGLILLVVKVGVVLLVPPRLEYFAAAAVAAHVVGCAYTLWRLRTMARTAAPAPWSRASAQGTR